jgi:hypothetical protein
LLEFGAAVIGVMRELGGGEGVLAVAVLEQADAVEALDDVIGFMLGRFLQREDRRLRAA